MNHARTFSQADASSQESSSPGSQGHAPTITNQHKTLMTTTEQLISDLRAGWLTRQDVAQVINAKSDREARNFMHDFNSILEAQGDCILSTSAKAGYHIPDPENEQDVLMVLRAEKELRKKAISLFQRRKALDRWLSRCKDKEIASLFVEPNSDTDE